MIGTCYYDAAESETKIKRSLLSLNVVLDTEYIGRPNQSVNRKYQQNSQNCSECSKSEVA